MLCAPLLVQAQIHNFRRYHLENGLSQSQVSSIAQDKLGYIWLATEGGGLNRFDGKTFLSYTMQEGLSSNTIWKIFIDSRDEMWIGTDKGLSHFDGKRIEKIETPFSIMDKDVWDITEDKNGHIWIATGGYGVLRYDRVRWTKFGINDGLGFGVVYKIFCDINNHIWAGSAGYGIARFKGETFENVSDRTGLPGKFINEIGEDNEGTMLVFTEEGVFQFNGEKFNPTGYLLPKGEEATESFFDSKGNFWVSTINSGLYRYTGSRVSHYTMHNGLPSEHLLTIFKDHQGNIWCGFDGGGITVFQNDRFIHHNRTSGLINEVIKALGEDQFGNFWFGSEGGLIRFDGLNYTSYGADNGLHELNIHSLLINPDQTIWVGTDDGPALFKDGKFIPYPNSPDVTIGAVFCFFRDPETQQVWIGSDEGVLHFTGNGFDHRFIDSLPDVRVFNIRYFGREDYWLCTNDGPYRFNSRVFAKVPIQDEFGKLDAMDCWKDPAGNVWITTSRGMVVKRKNETIETIKKRDGLSSDNLYCMVYDGKFLWIGSDHGVDRIAFDEEWDIAEIRNYGKLEGFAGMECNANATLVDHTGKVWFGTVGGATLYDPQKDEKNITPPLMMIRGVRLLYEEVKWSQKYPDVKFKDGLPIQPLFRYRDNHLTFDFVGIDYVNPDAVKYRFMLEGFDDGWSPEKPENSATYSNLPPGKYTFKVQARNGDGYWSRIIEFPFEVDAPFWMKTWFYILMVPIAFLLFYGFVVFRTRNLNQAKRVLEEKVRQRTLEINKQKEELEKLSIVAHNMNEGVVICGPDGSIEWINDGFYRMAGFTKDEFANSIYGTAKTLQQMSSYVELDKTIQSFEHSREPFVYDSTHVNRKGEIVWTRGSLAPIYSLENKLVKIIAIYTDITDRKHAEYALEQSNKDLTDSIKYAKRIQEAILPSVFTLQSEFADSYVFYKPRDIVSGDFYWFSRINQFFVWAVADCTGHGVPGAFMSMIGNESLHQVAHNPAITGPDQCLHFLDKQVTRALHQEGEERESRDGMDIGICAIHIQARICQFSGANIPLYLIRDGEVSEFEAIKESIGGYKEREKEFYSHEFDLKSGDVLYMTTDGFLDQFGGDLGKKFMKKRFRELIAYIAPLPINEQRTALENAFEQWKGNRKQVDDILVIAIRIP